MSATTYKSCRRWWQGRGYIAIVRPGWTPAVSPMATADLDAPNEAQVYVLCVPRAQRHCIMAGQRRTRRVTAGQSETRPLTPSRREVVRYPARGKNPEQAKPPKTGNSASPRARLPWPLRGISDGWWAHLTGPYAAARLVGG